MRVLTQCCVLLVVLLEVAVGGLTRTTALVYSQVALEALKEVAKNDGVKDRLDGRDEEQEDAKGVGERMILIEAVIRVV